MSLARCTVIAIIGGAALSPGGQPDTTAAAVALLTKMQAAYKTVDALHIKVKTSSRYSGGMSADDMAQSGPDTLELRMQRPNKLFVSAASRREGEQSSYLVVSDGVTLSCWKSWTNTFVQTKAPAELTDIARQLPDDAIGTYVASTKTWEIQDILEWDLLTGTGDETQPITELLGREGAVLTTTGPERQGGALVHVLRLSLPVYTTTMESRYYLDAESYLVRGFVLSARGKHPETGRDFTADERGEYELFSTQPKFSDADFRFVAPRGARLDKGR